MQPLLQYKNECSLASISTLNSLSQPDYNAFSKLVREAGAVFTGTDTQLGIAINIGCSIAKALGFYVPADYPEWGKIDKGAPVTFCGKGIARVAFKPKRKRNFRSHVIAFEDGKFYESNGQVFNSWKELEADYKRWGAREFQLVRIFR